MSRNSEEPVFNQIEQIRTAQGLIVLALRISKALNKEVSELFSLTEQKKGKK
jgi:hypothetical protein